ncbi:metal-binding protein [Pseudomonas shirazica]|uniref:metal-binding protein n=1 Tax=Pseudomonas shirazica TaxID=1940636 RepID=UPI003AAF70A0
MGDFTKRLTERRMHTEIKQGYCLICGSYGRLTWDHVPPQGSITITKVEQVHLTEVMGVDTVPIKGVKSPNGSKFKTICKSCNSNHLGVNDQEVARVYKELTRLVTHHFTYANSPLNYVTLPFDSIRFSRAMIGHILSATSVNECLRTPVETPYFTPLQKFVMGDDTAIEHTHDLYCWFYPHRHHLSAKMFACWNHNNLCTISVLSFFPLAFSITEKGKGIYPSGATKVDLPDDRLYVNLSSGHFPYSGFPFTGLSGNQMLAMASSQAIVSYPIKD